MEKSVLDNSQVDDGSWLLRDFKKHEPARLEVVGACPRCGGPIYGPREVLAGSVPVTATRRSCACLTAEVSYFPDTMKTK